MKRLALEFVRNNRCVSACRLQRAAMNFRTPDCGKIFDSDDAKSGGSRAPDGQRFNKVGLVWAA